MRSIDEGNGQSTTKPSLDTGGTASTAAAIEKTPSIFVEEGIHLDEVLAMIGEAFVYATRLAERSEGSFKDVKAYMVDNRGEIDPSEKHQNELYLQEVDRQSAQSALSRERLGKLLDSPYFARIDFVFDDNAETITAYIGRFSFSHNSASVISDWRSPIAALFYDFDFGAAYYDAPSGRATGKLIGKRQFEISNGTLVYAIETGSSVRDEALQHALSRTSDRKMQSIISSIQREQNAIIRYDGDESMVIQGVAGSGKTSVALHRVAYLLYQQKGRLTSNSVAILSPNRVFGDYISKVLPELGEEPIKELYLQDIHEQVLGASLRVEPQRSSVDDGDEAWKERARFKGSFEFAEEVIRYLDTAMDTIFEGKTIAFGRHVVEGEWLDQRFYGYGAIPVEERLESIAATMIMDMHMNFFKIGTDAMPTKRKIVVQLMRMLKAKDALSLYKRFLAERGLKKYFHAPAKQTIEWEDAAPVVLFQEAFTGLYGYSMIGHLVIDEMQDLTPVQHMMMARLFTCKKTILGDYHQMVDPNNGMDLMRMQAVYDGSRVFELGRSYRSTQEIIELAKKVKDIPELEYVSRHGDEPAIIGCVNTAGVIARLGTVLERFAESGFNTLGILHKSDEIARRYHEVLSRDFDVSLITPESDRFENGVSISSIRMAKGLEFDEVVVLDADQAHYNTDYDRNLLYVAITRAMHKVSLLYRSEPSGFLT